MPMTLDVFRKLYCTTRVLACLSLTKILCSKKDRGVLVMKRTFPCTRTDLYAHKGGERGRFPLSPFSLLSHPNSRQRDPRKRVSAGGKEEEGESSCQDHGKKASPSSFFLISPLPSLHGSFMQGGTKRRGSVRDERGGKCT